MKKKEMLENIEAVIFDLDGSLVDSMWMWRDIDIEYLSRFNILLPENLQSKIEGKSFHETALFFKEHFQIPDSIEQMKADWNQMARDKYANQVPLKPGVLNFLDYCVEHHIKLGIATSNSRELVEVILKAHSLEEYFTCILTGCDIIKGKPDPEIYLSVAKTLMVPSDRCLVFEDIIPGIMAGKNAGMRVCAVEDAYSHDDRTKKEKYADYYINDYFEIL